MKCFNSLARSRLARSASACKHLSRSDNVRTEFSVPINTKQLARRLTSTLPRGKFSQNLVKQGKATSSQNQVGLGIAFAAAALTAGLTLVRWQAITSAEEHNDRPDYIRLDEVRKHNRDAETHWVYRGKRVYDITDFIEGHPGGEVILRAVGGSIEPYWDIFSIHQKQDVYDILEGYFIGEIDPRDLVDGQAPVDEIGDPFQTDPKRSRELLVHTARPFNAETPTSDLQSFVTPTERFFTRNHMWVPPLEEEFRLTIELPDGTESTYSLDDIKKKFKEHTITATIQCSGNRRLHMNTGSSEDTSGIAWDVGAISNAEWTGVRMLDVLQDAGLDISDCSPDIRHVQFSGAEAYGASVPIEKVLDRYGDVLIVYSMNGKPLSRDHGFPLRALVPGHVAARSVKWLNRISLSEEESTSQWQRRDYKCFGPNEGKNPDWDSAVAIQETPVQSAITSAREIKRRSLKKDSNHTGTEQESDNEDYIRLDGYAYAGGGRRVVRVDVSPDDGKTWEQAEFVEGAEKGQKSWSWRRWSHALPSKSLNGNVCVKATDEAYNTQPETFPAYWNHRGNLATSWHRLPATAISSKQTRDSRSV